MAADQSAAKLYIRLLKLQLTFLTRDGSSAVLRQPIGGAPLSGGVERSAGRWLLAEYRRDWKEPAREALDQELCVRVLVVRIVAEAERGGVIFVGEARYTPSIGHRIVHKNSV